MRYSIVLVLLIPSFLIAQENNAKIYLKTGYIAEGKIVIDKRNHIRFKETSEDGTSRTNYYKKSKIFLLITFEGRVIVSNLSLRGEFESNRAINYADAEIDTSHLAIASKLEKVRNRKLKTKILSNPDGRIGQPFLDVGWGTTSGNSTQNDGVNNYEPDVQDFSLTLGVPLFEHLTLFGGFRYTSSETLDEINSNIGGNRVFVKARIYIF